MKTAIWVAAVNNYLPELCSITFPNLKEFAHKIGAEFNVITERKFLDFPPSYEKLQVHELGKDYDWNILIDADIILHPDMPDPRLRISKNFLGTYYGYDLRIAFNRIDPYMETYSKSHGNRYHGIVTNFLIANKEIHNVWEPLGCTFEECKDWCCRTHILDEYAISKNIGKYNIPYDAIILREEEYLIYHICAEDRNVEGKEPFSYKLNRAIQLLKEWE